MPKVSGKSGVAHAAHSNQSHPPLEGNMGGYGLRELPALDDDKPSPPGFPTYHKYKELEAAYLASLSKVKRNKALITQKMFDNIWDVLLEPNVRVRDAQFRFWVRKMFTLSTPGQACAVNGIAHLPGEPIVMHRDRPVAIKEQLYELLCYCHAVAHHGGRDKTCAAVRQHYSWVPKELIARFVMACPTCTLKKAGNNNPFAITARLPTDSSVSEGPQAHVSDLIHEAIAAAASSCPASSSMPHVGSSISISELMHEGAYAETELQVDPDNAATLPTPRSWPPNDGLARQQLYELSDLDLNNAMRELLGPRYPNVDPAPFDVQQSAMCGGRAPQGWTPAASYSHRVLRVSSVDDSERHQCDPYDLVFPPLLHPLLHGAPPGPGPYAPSSSHLVPPPSQGAGFPGPHIDPVLLADDDDNGMQRLIEACERRAREDGNNGVGDGEAAGAWRGAAEPPRPSQEDDAPAGERTAIAVFSDGCFSGSYAMKPSAAHLVSAGFAVSATTRPVVPSSAAQKENLSPTVAGSGYGTPDLSTFRSPKSLTPLGESVRW